MSEQADKQVSEQVSEPEVGADNFSQQLSELESTVKVKEIGGPKGPEPTRFGDWERKGRCVDF